MFFVFVLMGMAFVFVVCLVLLSIFLERLRETRADKRAELLKDMEDKDVLLFGKSLHGLKKTFFTLAGDRSLFEARAASFLSAFIVLNRLLKDTGGCADRRIETDDAWRVFSRKKHTLLLGTELGGEERAALWSALNSSCQEIEARYRMEWEIQIKGI
ncbi:MAG: uncharacterized protein A8A55_2430 [Amphiamblys sp. WSBS2006]|nr:MAG: uncharacterized protein A8A55_2430 [Amphiamblys sp. WSBS2006]